MKKYLVIGLLAVILASCCTSCSSSDEVAPINQEVGLTLEQAKMNIVGTWEFQTVFDHKRNTDNVSVDIDMTKMVINADGSASYVRYDGFVVSNTDWKLTIDKDIRYWGGDAIMLTIGNDELYIYKLDGSLIKFCPKWYEELIHTYKRS